MQYHVFSFTEFGKMKTKTITGFNCSKIWSNIRKVKSAFSLGSTVKTNLDFLGEGCTEHEGLPLASRWHVVLFDNATNLRFETHIQHTIWRLTKLSFKQCSQTYQKTSYVGHGLKLNVVQIRTHRLRPERGSCSTRARSFLSRACRQDVRV